MRKRLALALFAGLGIGATTAFAQDYDRTPHNDRGMNDTRRDMDRDIEKLEKGVLKLSLDDVRLVQQALVARGYAIKDVDRKLNSDTVERRYISETLGRCDGNKKETAKVLGISRKSLYNKLTRYKIG